jgi:hypothetical protein
MGETCSAHDEIRNAYEILVGKPKGRENLDDLGAGGKIILKCIFGK